MTLTHKPALLSSGVSIVAALVATVAAGLGSMTGLAFAAVGALALGIGLALGNRTAVDAGAVAIFFGVVAAGLEAVVVTPTVLGTIAVVLAWDLAHAAIDIGEQLGRETPTRRLEAVAIVSSMLVGLFAGTLGYAVFIAGAGGQPVAMVVLLLLAAALITIGLGKRRSGSGSGHSRHTERSRRY
ncbi:hypothetical protein G6M89_09930 [Natronolimnobius sp. AArcel1]|nr:hypothetical protein [Natronolimnobius sp. AArcel1]